MELFTAFLSGFVLGCGAGALILRYGYKLGQVAGQVEHGLGVNKGVR